MKVSNRSLPQKCISSWWSLFHAKGMLFSLSELFGMFFHSCFGDILVKMVLDFLVFCRYFFIVSLHGCAKSSKCAEHIHQTLFPQTFAEATHPENEQLEPQNHKCAEINQHAVHVFPMEVAGICSNLAMM